MRTRSCGQRGAVIPMVAITLTVLMGFSGLAIDVGFLEYRQQQQQSAVPTQRRSGGAQKLASNSCTSTSGVQSATR